MKFRSQRSSEPEINLIAFIDVLLVILIFLMLSSTYNKYTELNLNLPTADTKVQAENAQEILVSVTSDGLYAVNKQALSQRGIKALSQCSQARFSW
ncbi:MAG: biopolymer transporter ExbD [Betaproteobacteria bacterium]|nr:biopolymer transporter ExbD [Betaproteobacteria bacterium]